MELCIVVVVVPVPLKSNAHIHVERSFEDVANEHSSTFCLYQDEDGSLYLKKEHAYYYQIQMQMELSQVNYCDFVLWREGEMFHQRILLDEDFINETFQRAETFVKMALLPELVGKWFSKQNHVQTNRKTLLLLTLHHKGGVTVVKTRPLIT